MTYSDRKIDGLVVNRLTRGMFDAIRKTSGLENDQIYVITDEFDGFSKVFVNGTMSNLSVAVLSASEYESLVSADNVDPSTIYIVNDEVENMYGQRVVNVGNPVEKFDAVNKDYVDEALKNVVITTPDGKIDLGNYYTKAETAKILGDIESLIAEVNG